MFIARGVFHIIVRNVSCLWLICHGSWVSFV